MAMITDHGFSGSDEDYTQAGPTGSEEADVDC